MTLDTRSSLLIGIPAVPDDTVAGTFLLTEPLWKSGDITVWRSGAGLMDLAPSLADALLMRKIWSAMLWKGVPELSLRWIATTWSGALVLDVDSCDPVILSGWTEATRYESGDSLALIVLKPNRNRCSAGGPGQPVASAQWRADG